MRVVHHPKSSNRTKLISSANDRRLRRRQGAGGGRGGMGNWGELLEDLLILIAKRIALLEDFIVFSRVCKQWRSVAVEDNFQGSHQIPWLMLAESEDGDGDGEREFVSLVWRDRKVMLPEAKGKRCLESLGWLVTSTEEGEMSLLHPFTRARIGLPHLSTLEHYVRDDMANDFDVVQKAVLSSSPCTSDDYVLMIIYHGCGWLGFWRPGAETWTSIETRVGAFRDITYHKGKFYGVDAGGRVFACDVGGDAPTVAHIVGDVPRRIVSFKRSYIVESPGGGALLVVVRDGFQLNFLNGYGQDPYVDYENLDESRLDYGTHEFQLFEIELNNNGRCVEKKSLGDNVALFVGFNASISIDVSRIPGIKGNCVYYTDDCWQAYCAFKRGGGKDMGIYNLEDGSITAYCKVQSFSHNSPPIWVNPFFSSSC